MSVKLFLALEVMTERSGFPLPGRASKADATRSGATLLMVTGLALATASMAQWAQLHGQLPIGQNGAGLVRLCALLTTLLATSVRIWVHWTRRLPHWDIWTVGYGSLLILLTCFAIFAFRTGSVAAMTILPAAVFATYGTLWAVAATGGLGRLVAPASWLVAAILAWLADHSIQYFVYGIVLAALLVLPAVGVRKAAR